MKKLLSCFLLICIIILVLSGCASKGSIVGTWVVSEYHTDNKIISTDDIGIIYGEMAAEFNKYSLIFTASGNVTLIRPDFHGSTTNANLGYTIQEGFVEIFDPSNKAKHELYEYDGQTISICISEDLTIIFTKE